MKYLIRIYPVVTFLRFAQCGMTSPIEPAAQKPATVSEAATGSMNPGEVRLIFLSTIDADQRGANLSNHIASLRPV
jgi:hypothetical protein